MRFDEFLIQEVRKNELLYNLLHPDYKNVAKKEVVWLKIAEKVNTKAHLCKKRWKTLRDSYKKNKNMLNPQNGSSPHGKKRPWKYYNLMTFLEYVQSSRRTIENIVCKNEAYEEPDPIEMANVEMCNSPLLDSDSQSCPKTGKSDLIDVFPEYGAAVCNVSENCSKANDEYNSTIQLFGALAKKVITSNLSPSQITEIESCVSALVFQKLTQIMRKNNL